MPPQWVRLLELPDMDVRYERCAGVELLSEEGDRYLVFLSGYCLHNTGRPNCSRRRRPELRFVVGRLMSPAQ
jgi:hypothetical protein